MTVSISKIKDYLGISVSTHDSVFTSLMTAVCAFIEGYCSRIFDDSTYTNEIYCGSGKQYIFLKNYPVTTFTKIEHKSGSNSSPVWTEYSVDDYDLIDNRKLYKAGGWPKGEGANVSWIRELSSEQKLILSKYRKLTI